uniref:Uncharacterized protein n=1 Tax=Timspurckia oligopyrenoides TaxID=708627 RepID=A0A7S1ETG1_9RHOD|mmetsp:Transcript_6404/g.11410  ORF Transcript_6404/g.11410 Transcript_6404/m.11410 type:complete len:303 (+) Transcript_6404:546-1454(+)
MARRIKNGGQFNDWKLKLHTDGLPILAYNNARMIPAIVVVQWLLTLESAIREKHGNIADIFNEDSYPEYQYPEDPVLVEGTSEGRKTAIIAVYTDRVKRMGQLMNELELNKVKVYAILWNHMSEESHDIVKADDEFMSMVTTKTIRTSGSSDEDEMEEDVMIPKKDDPLTLLRIIKRTHLISSTNSVLQTKLEAEEAFRATKQGKESLVMYKERMNASLMALKVAKSENLPDNERIVHHFILNLDSDYFKTAMEDYLNNKIQPMPKTLDEAYLWALNYKRVNVTGKIVQTHTYSVDSYHEDS